MIYGHKTFFLFLEQQSGPMDYGNPEQHLELDNSLKDNKYNKYLHNSLNSVGVILTLARRPGPLQKPCSERSMPQA